MMNKASFQLDFLLQTACEKFKLGHSAGDPTCPHMANWPVSLTTKASFHLWTCCCSRKYNNWLREMWGNITQQTCPDTHNTFHWWPKHVLTCGLSVVEEAKSEAKGWGNLWRSDDTHQSCQLSVAPVSPTSWPHLVKCELSVYHLVSWLPLQFTPGTIYIQKFSHGQAEFWRPAWRKRASKS